MSTWRTRAINRMKHRDTTFVSLVEAGMYAPTVEYNAEFTRQYAEKQVRLLCELQGWTYRWSDRRQGWNLRPAVGKE